MMLIPIFLETFKVADLTEARRKGPEEVMATNRALIGLSLYGSYP